MLNYNTICICEINALYLIGTTLDKFHIVANIVWLTVMFAETNRITIIYSNAPIYNSWATHGEDNNQSSKQSKPYKSRIHYQVNARIRTQQPNWIVWCVMAAHKSETAHATFAFRTRYYRAHFAGTLGSNSRRFVWARATLAIIMSLSVYHYAFKTVIYEEKCTRKWHTSVTDQNLYNLWYNLVW